MGLDLLGCNFREIFVAVHNKEFDEVELVPDIFGNRVYHASEGWGRFWRWFFDLIKFFNDDDFEQQKLRNALQKTHNIFKEKLFHIKEDIQKYQVYLQEEIADNLENEDDYHRICHSITNWSRETTGFLSLAKLKENEKLSKIFQQHYNSEGENPFSCNIDEDLLQKIQCIIDLEGALQRPLPLLILKKLATSQSINESESHRLDSWINKINQAEAIDLKIFHAGLTACVDYFSSKQTPADLPALELALIDRKCEIFDREDPEHLAWRGSLKKGDIIQCNGKEIKLSDPFPVKFTEHDRRTIFTIEDNPHQVVVIGMNKSLLALEKRVVAERAAGACFLNYIDVDKEGKCAIVERLKRPLDRIHWVGKKALDLTDANTAKPIASLIKYWIENKIILRDMQLENFMFSYEDILKCSKVNFPEEIDYVALEDFTLKCAKGNLAVFVYLMEKSTLVSQPYRKLYNLMAQHALKDEKKQAGDVASSLHIEDYKITDRAQKLYYDIRNLKQTCCSTICENFQVPDKRMLLKQVNQAILEFHTQTHSGGIIWHSAHGQIVESVTAAMQLETRSSQLLYPDEMNNNLLD